MSDFHFGNTFDFLLEPLRVAVEKVRPDLVAVSGDFVEHAKKREFKQAREFLETLPKPQLVVAGNHDLAFYDPRRRLLEGLKRYRRYIADVLEPVFEDEEMIVIGVNTPRKIPFKGGRINKVQIRRVQDTACNLMGKRTRILITHHPLDLPDKFKSRALARHADAAVEALAPCLDLMLAGHIHLSSTGATAARYKVTGHSIIFAQAGTALSKRNKGEPNSFNVVRLDENRIEVQHQTWQEESGAFEGRKPDCFERSPEGWCSSNYRTDVR